jgi:hypothetical protein
LAYSRGRDRYDAYPLQRTAESFSEFAEAVLRDRATHKGNTFVSAPFKANGDGQHHRCEADVLPRRWIPFDLDAIADGETFSELVLLLQHYSGFGYTTFSHTPEAPRMRFILEASREMTREEGMRVGLALQRRIDADLGAGRLK